MPQQLQQELERLIAGYPQMSRLDQKVILGLVEARMKATAPSKPQLRLVVSDGAFAAGGMRDSRSSENSVASSGI